MLPTPTRPQTAASCSIGALAHSTSAFALKVQLMTVLEHFGRLFRAADHSPNNHRMRWDECLSPGLKERLLPIQRAALWLGRDYDLDPRYEKEQAREGNGKVCWDTLDEHVLQAKL